MMEARDFLAVLFLVEVVLRHKMCVAHAALWLYARGVRPALSPWRVFVHDLSKIGPAELLPFARRYARHNATISLLGRALAWAGLIRPHAWEDDYGAAAGGENASFERAQRHHYERNEHHVPEHYGPCRRAPDAAVVEMAADWLAAERGYFRRWPQPPDAWPWLRSQLPVLLPKLHPENAALLCEALTRIGFGSVVDRAASGG